MGSSACAPRGRRFDVTAAEGQDDQNSVGLARLHSMGWRDGATFPGGSPPPGVGIGMEATQKLTVRNEMAELRRLVTSMEAGMIVTQDGVGVIQSQTVLLKGTVAYLEKAMRRPMLTLAI